jgi:pullulanase
MVVDMDKTNPAGWGDDKSPDFSASNRPTDAIIYELHVRDASIHAGSGIRNKGKYLGLAETGTHFEGLTTGLAHLQELGVTHVHLLPVADYYSVEEHRHHQPHYNWGYDPLNYNIPEGSYSSDPHDGAARIRELKQMIMGFHQAGIRVIMDVVYNHTALTERSNFNQLVPGYYYRHKKNGDFSDASSCGNETASERPMMRKFIIESLQYWVKEYHIDGFRFDLMGVHDLETMNLISKALHELKPDILLYGEGWAAGTSPLPDSERALKQHVSRLDRIAVFSDDARDAIKGSVFNETDKGFASGKPGMENLIKSCIVASCPHPQLHGQTAYAVSPHNIITYCECHDNHTLWDKWLLSNPEDEEADRIRMHNLALTIILTSQGIPFLHAGTEFLRTKKGVENSYKSPDEINAIDWSRKKQYHETVAYVKALINMRKAHPAFRMTTAHDIANHLQFDDTAPAGTVIYTLDGKAVGDSWKKIYVAFNGTGNDLELSLPPGEWQEVLPTIKSNSRITSTIISKYSAFIARNI